VFVSPTSFPRAINPNNPQENKKIKSIIVTDLLRLLNPNPQLVELRRSPPK